MIYEIQGSAKEPYKIDTDQLTCTCPQFKYRCIHFPNSSENHYCKHLSSVLQDHPEHAPAWYQKRFLASSPEEPTVLDDDGKLRYPRIFFDSYVYEIKSVLNRFPEIKRYEVCGSYRRRAVRCSDLDFLIELNPGDTIDRVFDYLESTMNYELIKNIGRGDKKASYMIDGIVHVDFKVIPHESWPFATLHFTGSKALNIQMRQKAISLGYSLSEYGFKSKDGSINSCDCLTEEDIFKFLRMKYLEPWERSL